MHHTIEEIQRSATPLVRGPLKIYLVLGALLLTITANSWRTHGVAMILFGLFTIHAVGIGPARLVGLPILFLIPGIGIILAFTPGDPVLSWWFISITDAGVATAMDTFSRSVTALTILAFLVLSTPVQTVVSTMRKFRVPTVVVELFLYVYRAIQVLFDEAVRMRTAATARAGFRTRRTTYRSTKLIAATLLVRTFDRIERFSDSMRARNYDGTLPVAQDFVSSGYPYAVGTLGILGLVWWL